VSRFGGRRLAVLGAVVGLALGIAADAQASTTVSPELQAQIDNDNVQGVVRGFGAVPIQGGDGATIDTWIADMKASAAANNTAAEALAGQLTKLEGKSGFLSKVRFLGDVGLAVGALDIGWKIGTGINAKWLHFGTSMQRTSPISYTNMHMHFYALNPGETGEASWAVPPGVETSPGYWRFESSPYGDKEFGEQDYPTRSTSPWRNFVEGKNGNNALETNQFGVINNCSGSAGADPNRNCWIRARASDAAMESYMRLHSSAPETYTNQS
jgi:hypothetical protein